MYVDPSYIVWYGMPFIHFTFHVQNECEEPLNFLKRLWRCATCSSKIAVGWVNVGLTWPMRNMQNDGAHIWTRNHLMLRRWVKRKGWGAGVPFELFQEVTQDDIKTVHNQIRKPIMQQYEDKGVVLKGVYQPVHVPEPISMWPKWSCSGINSVYP